MPHTCTTVPGCLLPRLSLAIQMMHELIRSYTGKNLYPLQLRVSLQEHEANAILGPLNKKCGHFSEMMHMLYTKLQEQVLYYHCEEISTFRRAVSKSWWTSPVLMTVFSCYSELIHCFWLKFVLSYFIHNQWDRDVIITGVFVGVRYTCKRTMKYPCHLNNGSRPQRVSMVTHDFSRSSCYSFSEEMTLHQINRTSLAN